MYPQSAISGRSSCREFHVDDGRPQGTADVGNRRLSATTSAKQPFDEALRQSDQALCFSCLTMLDCFSDRKGTDYFGNDGFLVTSHGALRYFAPNDAISVSPVFKQPSWAES